MGHCGALFSATENQRENSTENLTEKILTEKITIFSATENQQENSAENTIGYCGALFSDAIFRCYFPI